MAMGFSIAILFILPFLGKFKCKSSKFLGVFQFFFWCFVFNLIFLGWIGGCVVESPYILSSQLATGFYFSYFLIALPSLSFLEKELNQL